MFGPAWRHGIELVGLVVCGVLGLDYRGWQDKAVASSREVNRLLDAGDFQTVATRFYADGHETPQWPSDPSETQMVLFSGTTVLPLTAWGKVEVRMIICKQSRKYAEKLLWDLTATTPRLVGMTVTPL